MLQFLIPYREMENLSRGSTRTFGDSVTILTEGGRCRTSRLHDYRVQENRLPSPPSVKCNVLRESLSEDWSKYSMRNTKEMGVVGNLYIGGFIKDEYCS
jgi:hypothetical protein